MSKTSHDKDNMTGKRGGGGEVCGGLLEHEREELRDVYVRNEYSQSQCKFGKLMFTLTSIFPPLSLSGSSTYNSFTLQTQQRKVD